ncbi:MAG: hypothetical protein LBM87_01400 [Ruminococcus sp.]|jgi:hypothetical protein|nr:hypothetical protein [Ruminococcus sp.]
MIIKKFTAAVVLAAVLMSSCSREAVVEQYTDKTGTTTTAATTTEATTKKTTTTTKPKTTPAPKDTTTAAEDITSRDISDILEKLPAEQAEILGTYNDYVEQLSANLAAETAILQAYGSVSGASYTNDQVFSEMLINTVIPETEALVESLKRINVTDEELKSLNDMYIKGWEKHLDAFVMINDALIKSDIDLVADANVILAEGNQLILDFLSAIGDYVDKYNIITEVGGGQYDSSDNYD